MIIFLRLCGGIHVGWNVVDWRKLWRFVTVQLRANDICKHQAAQNRCSSLNGGNNTCSVRGGDSGDRYTLPNVIVKASKTSCGRQFGLCEAANSAARLHACRFLPAHAFAASLARLLRVSINLGPMTMATSPAFWPSAALVAVAKITGASLVISVGTLSTVFVTISCVRYSVLTPIHFVVDPSAS